MWRHLCWNREKIAGCGDTGEFHRQQEYQLGPLRLAHLTATPLRLQLAFVQEERCFCCTDQGSY